MFNYKELEYLRRFLYHTRFCGGRTCCGPGRKPALVRYEFDDVKLTVLPTGSLRLDGGAMFGVVPKPLWEREHEADDRNRILLAMNVLLIEDGDRRILIDTGAGEKWTDKERDIYGLKTSPAEDWLKPAGLTPSDIDLVICSHLHFDHAGGNTVRDRDGGARAAFPNAVYVIQKGELALARTGNERTRASYMPENYEPLVQAGQVRLVDGDSALTRFISLRLAPGHTPHMQVPLVLAGGSTFAYLADLVPTASHVRMPYIMGYDLEPMATLASKKAVLGEAARHDWRLVFEHDPVLPVGRLVEEKGRLKAVAVEPE